MVTVVSPPAIIHAGLGTGDSVLQASLAMVAKDFAASLLSPCIGEERTVVLYPNFIAFSLASSTAILLEPIITF
jgi:hypothetical protein